MKKVFLTILLSFAMLFGIEAAGQSNAYAQDVWVASDNYADYYVMTETITTGNTYRAYVKHVPKSGSRWSKTGLEFVYDEGDWWYGQFSPKSERTFRVYSSSTSEWVRAALGCILNY